MSPAAVKATPGAIQRNNPVGDIVVRQRRVAAQQGGHELLLDRAEHLRSLDQIAAAMPTRNLAVMAK